ncbi:hypothetical protein [Empedobacter tilapiae]
MNFINEKDEEFVYISNTKELNELLEKFTQKDLFAYKFKFKSRDYFIKLLKFLGIKIDDFENQYFYFDSSQKLHISESEFGYIWISTYGLIAMNKPTKNKFINAFKNQYTVINLLFEQAIDLSQSKKIYDVDSYNFGKLSVLTPAIFNNIIFYIELFCKAYLNLTGSKVLHTHKLNFLYQKTLETMSFKNHKDTLFQFIILDPLSKIIEHINKIPGDFREQFVKYDDNISDDTIIIFDTEELIKMQNVLEVSYDFIIDYFYSGEKSHYLETGTYKKILEKAKNSEEIENVKKMYGHLINDK